MRRIRWLSGNVYKSIDSGVTGNRLAWRFAGPFCRSRPLTAGLVYAGTDQGLFRSTDGGGNWTAVPNRSGKVVFDPVNASTLYLLTPKIFASAFKALTAANMDCGEQGT